MIRTPTGEQARAVLLFKAGGALAIEAGAGTGKTATLEMIAGYSPRARGQYVAFNAAIVREAGQRMPDRVACNTAHSLAMRAVGRQYAHRLHTSQRMKSWELAEYLQVNPIMVTSYAGVPKPLSRTYLAGLAMRAIIRFCQSADPAPTYRHVPYIDGLDDPVPRPRRYDVNRVVAHHLEPVLQRVWADATSTEGNLPYKHDYYLKLWQLRDPYIHAEYVLFDEAQDANPVMVDIVAQQALRPNGPQLVWVGDSQQQIYSFTGAINALADVPNDRRAYLTQSFRFGQPVADVANQVLAALDAPLRLRGYSQVTSRVGHVASPDVVLTRTNARAVRRVLEAQRAGVPVHLVGGGRDVVSFAEAALQLQRKERTSHPDLACFGSWAEVQDYVAYDEQGDDLRLLVSLVDEFGVPVILAALRDAVPEDRAQLVVSTAHKAKGREWGRVVLADDFPPASQPEDLRLLYVACTRAKHELDHSAVPWFKEQQLPKGVLV